MESCGLAVDSDGQLIAYQSVLSPLGQYITEEQRLPLGFRPNQGMHGLSKRSTGHR